MPVARQLGARWAGVEATLDVGPGRLTVPRHVTGGDRVRDALIAEGGGQPIEHHRGVVVSQGCEDAGFGQVGLNVIDQRRDAGDLANSMHDIDRVP